MTETIHPRPLLRRGLVNVLLLVVVAAAVGWWVLAPERASQGAVAVPHSAALEAATGVRFSRIAVVGDGGLLEVTYVVIDPERAVVFQSDRDHPPTITSDAREGGTQKASIMRGGHQMRPGQTYYFVYENTGGAVRSGEQADITYGGDTLQGVPVL